MVAAQTYAAMMLSSRPEDYQVEDFMSKGDVADTDDGGDAWPSYSAWDE